MTTAKAYLAGEDGCQHVAVASKGTLMVQTTISLGTADSRKEIEEMRIRYEPWLLQRMCWCGPQGTRGKQPRGRMQT